MLHRHRILVIDDSRELLASLRTLLESEGLEVRVADEGLEGLREARAFRPHCILVDYYMPGMNGEDVVARVRAFDALTQIVLMTGHPGERPGREMMRRLDIQGYHAKSESTERLLVSIDGALKAYRQLSEIERQSRGLRKMLEASPRIHRFQPLTDLCATALGELVELTQSPRALIATLEADDALVVRSEIPVPARARRGGSFIVELRKALGRALDSGTTEPAEGFTVAAIRLAGAPLGVLAIEGDPATHDPGLLLLFANQLALAIENVRLYEMATLDSLTQLQSRRHFLERLDDWLRLSVRDRRPLSLILVDLDGLKTINDRLGHVAGDRAIARAGECIRSVIRETDIGGRYGGDEFAIVTPHTAASGAGVLAERLRYAIAEAPVDVDGEMVRLTASIAYGGFDSPPLEAWTRRGLPKSAWKELATRLIGEVDAALYVAKGSGRNRVVAAGEDGAIDRRIIEIARSLEVA
ncbi:MAG: diguanylate cyclase [Deltaproteobacteria bacterium]|nr:diguanylate cyclase [Deltaproteobacteria bacterium]